jgi:hypothetical protein
VQLFVVPVRAATPSKTQGEISIRGVGCDTSSVNIEVTVFK